MNAKTKNMISLKTMICLLVFFSFLTTLNTGSLLLAGDSNIELIRHLEQTIKANEIFSILKELTSETYEGRLTGTDGYNKAADFAASYFKKYGVLPIGKDYMQTFPVSYTKVYEGILKIYLKDKEGNEETMNCIYFKDFYPMNSSGSGDIKAEIVFAGYSVTAPEYGYDDYQGIDARGKIVMIFRGVPQAKAGQDWEKYHTHRFRTKNAREHGAVGLMYIYSTHCNLTGHYLEDFPMVFITPALANRILAGKNLSVSQLREKINSRGNCSFATGISAHLKIRSENFQGAGKNVLGYIPGSDPAFRDEFIVVGAHLDHCGMWPRLTPGAHDNASGSAVVLAVARALGTFPQKPKRSILFSLFAGEEMALAGSKYFVSHLPPRVKKIKFYINMDMVGSGSDIYVMRLKNYPGVENLFYEAASSLGLRARLSGSEMLGNPPYSDHAAFIEKGFPAIAVYSAGGPHHGAHTDADTIEQITPQIMEEIGKLVSCTALKLGNEKEIRGKQ